MPKYLTKFYFTKENKMLSFKILDDEKIISFYLFSLPGWNELLIASFSHRSVTVKDGILLATGLHVHRSSAHSAGVGSIFDRLVARLEFDFFFL